MQVTDLLKKKKTQTKQIELGDWQEAITTTLVFLKLFSNTNSKGQIVLTLVLGLLQSGPLCGLFMG